MHAVQYVLCSDATRSGMHACKPPTLFFFLFAIFNYGNFADLLSSCGPVVRDQLGPGSYMDSLCGPLGERLNVHFSLPPHLGI